MDLITTHVFISSKPEQLSERRAPMKGAKQEIHSVFFKTTSGYHSELNKDTCCDRFNHRYILQFVQVCLLFLKEDPISTVKGLNNW